MRESLVSIAGLGSVSPYGPIAGLIPQRAISPVAITAWATEGLRRAFLVEPFQPAKIVPGVKTRRLDRLSAWALVASSLAIRDAGIDLSQVDRSRVAVFFSTGFGCVELTESFFRSAAANGWGGTDPITFPETLANSPASHVALFHGLRGPNITIGSKRFGGESALIQCASLLRHGQADLAIVLSGDTITQAVYEWYEASGLLSSACYNEEPWGDGCGFVPSEGVAAVVLERADSRGARTYGHLREGRWTAGGHSLEVVHTMLNGAIPDLILCAGNGGPCTPSPAAALAREVGGQDAVIIPPDAVAAGMTDTGALLHLIVGLSNGPKSGLALLLGTSGGTSHDHGFAALLLELP
jgi:3-oxoacyl-[acyl-carrier-protein] synthase II